MLLDIQHNFKTDEKGLKLIKKVQVLIEAIEFYNIGKWDVAVEKYLKFLSENYEVNHIICCVEPFRTSNHNYG